MQILRDLQTMRKGNLLIEDYLQNAKKLADNLSASGNPMVETNLQQVILNGLDTTYDAIVTSLTTTLDDTTMEDFQAHLLAFEARLQPQIVTDHIALSANNATKTQHGLGRGFSSSSPNRGRGNNI